MKILKLSVSNFKRIEVVEVSPDGNVVVLGGDNGAGKSSVLDAIMTALVGPRAMPAMPVHAGADGAEITVDCGEVVVVRKIKPDGNQTLKVTTKDGMNPSSPQAWLDKQIGQIAFDPLAFTRLDMKAQAETLRKLVGIDVADLDAEHAATYQERLELGRQGQVAAGAAAALPHFADAPAAEVSVADLAAEVQAASQKQAERARLEGEARNLESQALAHTSNAQLRENEAAELPAKSAAAVAASDAEFDREIARLEAELVRVKGDKARKAASIAESHAQSEAMKLQAAATARAEAEALAAQAKELRAQAEAIAVPDSADMQQRLASVESDNQKVRANAAKAAAEAKAADLRAQYKAKTDRLAAIATERQARIGSATFPVAGMGFNADGAVTFNGIPLSQASQAEQIRVSMAIGLALNPALRVVLVRDASLLDNKSMAMVAEMAATADAQVWLERVSDGDAGAVVIEDGRVRG